MKRLLICLLFIFLFAFTSCKVKESSSEYNDVHQHDNKEEESEKPVVKEYVNVTYYLDEIHYFECVQKTKEVILPDYLLTTYHTGNSKIYSFLYEYEHLDDYAYRYKYSYELEWKSNAVNRRPAFFVEWYFDQEFTKPATSDIDDDIVLYAKPYGFFLQWLSDGNVFGGKDPSEEYLYCYFDYKYFHNVEELKIKEDYTFIDFDRSKDIRNYSIENRKISSPVGRFNSGDYNYIVFDEINVKKLIIPSSLFIYHYNEKRADMKEGDLVIKSVDLSKSPFIEEIIINGDIDHIYSRAFDELPNLKKITINGHVGKIWNTVFRKLPLLEEICFTEVDEMDENLFSDVNENVVINFLNNTIS